MPRYLGVLKQPKKGIFIAKRWKRNLRALRRGNYFCAGNKLSGGRVSNA